MLVSREKRRGVKVATAAVRVPQRPPQKHARHHGDKQKLCRDKSIREPTPPSRILHSSLMRSSHNAVATANSLLYFLHPPPPSPHTAPSEYCISEKLLANASGPIDLSKLIFHQLYEPDSRTRLCDKLDALIDSSCELCSRLHLMQVSFFLAWVNDGDFDRESDCSYRIDHCVDERGGDFFQKYRLCLNFSCRRIESVDFQNQNKAMTFDTDNSRGPLSTV